MQLHITIAMITIVMITIVIGMMYVSVMYVLGMIHWLMNVVVNIGYIRNVNLHAMDP